MDVNPDDWTLVSDRRRRKTIQDRLAQRTRRNRLASRKAGANDSQPNTCWAWQTSLPGTQQAQSAPSSEELDITNARSFQNNVSVVRTPDDTDLSFFAQEMRPCSLGISSADSDMMSYSNNTVFTALYKNGRILGIPCGTQMMWKSPRCSPSVPASLQPTVLQQTILHTSWIDRFPFPHMRDRFIQTTATISEEDFLAALFDTTGFTILPGFRSWDPDGWIINKRFGEQWGFLFF